MGNKLDHLSQFTGSEQFYRHPIYRKVVYTEVVHYVAERAEAYWLVDDIAICQMHEAVKPEEFQLWKLTVKPDSSAELTCEDGNGKVVYAQHYGFTTFPPQGISFYFTDNTLLLPSEY